MSQMMNKLRTFIFTNDRFSYHFYPLWRHLTCWNKNRFFFLIDFLKYVSKVLSKGIVNGLLPTNFLNLDIFEILFDLHLIWKTMEFWFQWKIPFLQSLRIFWFFINFTFQRCLTLTAIFTIWSNVIGYLIVLYESSGPQLNLKSSTFIKTDFTIEIRVPWTFRSNVDRIKSQKCPNSKS